MLYKRFFGVCEVGRILETLVRKSESATYGYQYLLTLRDSQILRTVISSVKRFGITRISLLIMDICEVHICCVSEIQRKIPRVKYGLHWHDCCGEVYGSTG